MREENFPAHRNPRPADTAENAGRPAWLTPERTEASSPANLPPAPEDTLQGSRERLATRWFALRGVLEGSAPPAQAAPAPVPARPPVTAIFSLAGGVGKTSLVATLGRALSARGERVLLVDTAAYGLLPFFFGAGDQRPGMLRTFNPPSASGNAPVQMITLDEDRQHGLARGAFSFVTKPTTTEGVQSALRRMREYAKPRKRRLLIVEDNEAEQLSISELLGHDDIEIVTAGTGAEALAIMREMPCDCVVLDLRLPDMSGMDVLEQLKTDAELSDIPVVVFTGRQMSAEEDAELHTMARSIVVKGVESPERLLDETALFLHRVVTDLPAKKQQMLEKLTISDEDLVNRVVLLVDDDARNIFALSSILERRGMRVLTATTGNEAIQLVESTPDIAIVLMDIMMPEMDGYRTTARIREDARHRRLPIIALTAKAMKGDREKCLEAGASDYLAKPVNTEQLLSALRMWLHR